MITVSLIILAVLAYLGHSLVMLASVAGMAIGIWFAYSRSGRVLAATLIGGAVGASLAAEAVHLLHHMRLDDSPDHGGFWVSALLVGLINAGAMLPIVAIVRIRSAKSSGPSR